jgi:metallophosphoesterase (TIGR00282 family)
MRILFLGDVVGRAGREAVIAKLPELRRQLAADLVLINVENASHGFGVAPDMAEAFLAAGADALTLGNHAFDRREIVPYLSESARLIRPLNYPPNTPGQGLVRLSLPDGRKVLVLNLMGRLFMELLDCPFRAAESVLAGERLGATVNAIIVDFHAEATSEKMAFAHAFDGRVSLVVGTHTHCPTADAQILPGGTAYQSDLGMCGDYDSVIGMRKEQAVARFYRKWPNERLEPAEGEATLAGLFVETDDRTGLARRLAPVRIGGRLQPALPDF